MHRFRIVDALLKLGLLFTLCWCALEFRKISGVLHELLLALIKLSTV